MIHVGSHFEGVISFAAPWLPTLGTAVPTGSVGIFVTVVTPLTVAVAKAVEIEGNLSVNRTTVDVRVIIAVSVTTGTVQDSVVERWLVGDPTEGLAVSDAEVSGSTVVG